MEGFIFLLLLCFSFNFTANATDEVAVKPATDASKSSAANSVDPKPYAVPTTADLKTNIDAEGHSGAYERVSNLGLYLDSARLGKWTEDYGRALKNYKKVLEAEPDNKEAKEAIEEINKIISPRLELKSCFYGDSEGFDKNTYGAFYSFYPNPSTFLRTGYYRSRFSQHGTAIYENSYDLKLQRRLTPKFSGSLEYIYNDYDKIANHNSYIGDLYYQALDTTGLYFYFGHLKIIDTFYPFSIYGYNIINSINAALAGTTTYDYMLAINHRINDKLIFLSSFTYGDYSDNNRKRSIFAHLDYTFAQKPEMHVKYAYYTLDYEKATSDYWSPSFFNVHTLFFQIKQPIGERLNLMGETSISYSPQSPNLGGMVLSELSYKIQKDWEAKLSAFYARSPRKGENSFWSRNFTASLSRRF